ncbi:MAG: ribosomal protein S18-alanine N-acetyltransferase [Acidobacteriota bacterium]
MRGFHLSQVLVLEKEAFPHPWSRESFLNEIQAGDHARPYVIRLGERVAGYLCFWNLHREIRIQKMAVARSCRRRGLGARLLHLALEEGRVSGCRAALLEVREGNLAARALYSGAGFRSIGRRKGYYPPGGEDALVMSRPFDPSCPP